MTKIGPIGIPTYILTAAANELAPMLTMIYQPSLGRVPADWRPIQERT